MVYVNNNRNNNNQIQPRNNYVALPTSTAINALQIQAHKHVMRRVL